MINRELIRLKVVQVAYAFYENGASNVATAQDELQQSLDSSYDLYHFLLLLMLDINRVAQRSVETAQSRNQRLGLDEVVSEKFANNRFIAQLAENKELQAYREESKRSWINYESDVRKLLAQIEQTDFYDAYMHSGESSYEEDRALWRNIYRKVLCNCEMLDDILEELSIYWNDDKDVIDSFVLKTIKKFDEAQGADQPLLPMYKDAADEAYAKNLLTSALDNGEAYRKLIDDNSTNWDMKRISLMDVVIMQVALAEMLNFPDIPAQVSINEYVEIAKYYSTPRSNSFVNGLLDGIRKRLEAEGKLVGKK